MKISVIGAGYVGLVSAVGFASAGHDVVCIDTDKNKVNSVNKGISPLCEAGLEELISTHVLRSGNLKASTEYKDISGTDISLICVGTPSQKDGSIDLSYVVDAVEKIGSVLRSKDGYHVVVTRSTIIPGTTKDVVVPLLEKCSGRKTGDAIGVVFNPEFLQEGTAVRAFFNPDRIIIGECDTKAGDIVAELYKDTAGPIVRTDMTTAEMIKYASNAFLATKISFINEIANICHKLGVDVYDVVEGLKFDYRIGDRFMNAGIGFGGSCLPKDLKALTHTSSIILDYPAPLLKAVLQVNEVQALKMIEVAEQMLCDLGDKVVSVLGLAFKPNTDDIREAPSLRIIEVLLKKGAHVKVYDPQAMENARAVLPSSVQYCDGAAEAIEDSDCVLIVTEWEEFRDESLYRGKLVIDGRRALNPQKANSVCDYLGICW
jgi:UDPglucose 6-dehydrogenase